MKQELILIKVGEIALKGLNRRTFEDVLMKNIKRHLAPLGKFEVRSAQSTIYVRPLEEGVDLDDACERVGKVFGIAAYSRACMAKKDMDDINRTAAEYLKEALEEALLEYRRPGDTILVKASHFMGFSEIVKKLEQPQ